MTIGTRSVLFGAHQFLLHPIFVAVAWTRLYGFPWDPRLWLAFIVHDLGYLGKRDMDGVDGESHPELGARIMGALFGTRWYQFCLFHSRYYAKRHGSPPSRLCMADKLSFVVTPAWLYLPMTRLTGEIYEYMSLSSRIAAAEARPLPRERLGLRSRDPYVWHAAVSSYLSRWVEAHADGSEDTWTDYAGTR